MKDTPRTKRINNALNAHYKSNKGCWWVSHSPNFNNIIHLHKGDINNRLTAVQIAKFILDHEKSVSIVHYGGAAMIYTRESVKGYKRNKRM